MDKKILDEKIESIKSMGMKQLTDLERVVHLSGINSDSRKKLLDSIADRKNSIGDIDAMTVSSEVSIDGYE